MQSKSHFRNVISLEVAKGFALIKSNIRRAYIDLYIEEKYLYTHSNGNSIRAADTL